MECEDFKKIKKSIYVNSNRMSREKAISRRMFKV